MKTLILCFVLITRISFAQTIIGTGADASKAIKISTILAQPQEYLGKTITVEGTVIKVCIHSGTKMQLASDKKYQDIMIMAPNRQTGFPPSAIGKKAVVTGTFEKSPKQKDYAECDEKYAYVIKSTGATISQ